MCTTNNNKSTTTTTALSFTVIALGELASKGKNPRFLDYTLKVANTISSLFFLCGQKNKREGPVTGNQPNESTKQVKFIYTQRNWLSLLTGATPHFTPTLTRIHYLWYSPSRAISLLCSSMYPPHRSRPFASAWYVIAGRPINCTILGCSKQGFQLSLLIQPRSDKKKNARTRKKSHSANCLSNTIQPSMVTSVVDPIHVEGSTIAQMDTNRTNMRSNVCPWWHLCVFVRLKQ